MIRPRQFSGLLCACVVVCSAGTVQADPLPRAMSQRPLTLPRTMRSLNLSLDRSTIDLGFFGRSSITSLSLGGSFAASDNLELGGYMVPILLHPEFQAGGVVTQNGQRTGLEGFFLGGPMFYLRARTHHSARFEAAVQGALTLPMVGSSFGNPVLSTGLQLRFRLGTQAMIESGVQVNTVFDTDDIGVLLSVPLAVTVNVSDAVHLGARTALLTGAPGGGGVILPLGFHAGVTVARGDSEVPRTDLGLSLLFPFAVGIAGGSSGSALSEYWVLSFNANIFFQN